jgi:hypothetical protein
VVEFLRACGIDEVVDIGPPLLIRERLFERHGIKVRSLGFLPAMEVSRELMQCRLGLLQYPLNCVAKSSVFAAYAAHGVVPILRSGGVASDGISIGRQVLSIDSSANAQVQSQLQRMSDEIRMWYRSSLVHAKALIKCCRPAVYQLASL